MLQASQYVQTGNQPSHSDTSQKSTQFCLAVCFISQAARYTCVQMFLESFVSDVWIDCSAASK